ncbi:aerolysin, part 1, authentic frameshift [Pyrobaculum aerophilum str. IM2]|uniref:Aerolysin, part 1, authentic frameshift n=1 Tax=Pyrobaculum aerophilum (strain ATCC 51768 / DSM 7523 / JCM 9630 / CIP 104966 / NBRC 100827 / IM2) TaxID=178306 RepID=Q8ZW43_PYRAE|nr:MULTISPECIES: S8 family serine peptidase [Pyrobaculum]AAL63859.1 aerolysin, part 1, authentic frameshift [Pyrobaculum aerophilum str. IM2]MCX8136925.1 S8 family serine peptidase [Pyrobaculum aerophilum]
MAALVAFLQAARIVVGYVDSPPTEALKELNKTGDIKIIKHLKEIKAIVLNIPDNKTEKLKEKLKGVRYIEEDGVAYAFGFSNYTDVQWNVKMINAPRVWDAYFLTFGDAAFGYGVKVAVLDTGIDYKHPELSGKVVYCINTLGNTLYKGTNLRKCADRKWPRHACSWDNSRFVE